MKKAWVFGFVLVVLVMVAVILWRVLLPASPTAGVLVTNGRIEGDQAVVGAKIGGKIVQLTVHEGDRVEAGGPIAALASEQLQAQLEQAEHVVHLAREELAASRARVVSAQRQVEAAETAVILAEQESRARIGEAQATMGAARARLQQAEADLEKAAKDYGRYQGLFAKKVISAQQLDTTRTADDVARAAVQAARKQVA